jgi:phage gpG-like protein
MMQDVKFTGLNELQKYVGTLEANHRQMLLEVAGETLISLTQERFALGKDPYDQPWKQSRRARDQGGQTLRDNGVLRNSFTWELNGTDSLIYGTNIKYAAIHQFGGEITPKKKFLKFSSGGKTIFAKKVTMPKRAMLPDERGDPPAYDLELKESLEAALNATLQKAGA